MVENVEYRVIHEQGDFGEQFNVTQLSEEENKMLNKQNDNQDNK